MQDVVVQFYLNIRGSRDLRIGLTLPRIAAANQNAQFPQMQQDAFSERFKMNA
jgi:hypothetical protein